MARRSRHPVPGQQQEERKEHEARAPERLRAHAQQASSPAVERHLRSHEAGARGGDGARQVRTRSWRVAKRLEDNTSAVEPRPIDAEADLSGTPLEGDRDLLARVQGALQLDDADTAALFGVQPPAVEEWRRRGVPPHHTERLEALREVVARLYSRGRMGSVGELARMPLGEAHGQCLLDLLSDADLDMERISDAVAAVKRRFAG